MSKEKHRIVAVKFRMVTIAQMNQIVTLAKIETTYHMKKITQKSNECLKEEKMETELVWLHHLSQLQKNPGLSTSQNGLRCQRAN